mgnify:CR=1 FL=1
MPTINLPPSLRALFSNIEARLQKLETAKKFTAPVTPQLASPPTITGTASGDPTTLQVGDIWLNTTSNIPKYVDATGAVSTFSGSGIPFLPRYNKTSYAYTTMVSATIVTSTAPSNQVMYATPIYIPQNITATALAINISALAGTTTQGVRLGIYSNSTTDDYPNQLLVDAGYVETSTTFGVAGWNTLTISTALTPGLYWLVGCRQATNAPTLYCLSSTTNGGSPLPFSTFAGATVPSIAWSQSGVTGALPSTFTATKTVFSGIVPQVSLIV